MKECDSEEEKICTTANREEGKQEVDADEEEFERKDLKEMVALF